MLQSTLVLGKLDHFRLSVPELGIGGQDPQKTGACVSLCSMKRRTCEWPELAALLTMTEWWWCGVGVGV